MSTKTTRVCDRCGKENIPSYISLEGSLNISIRMGLYSLNCNHESFDLCGSCIKEFKRFMKGKDVEVEEHGYDT